MARRRFFVPQVRRGEAHITDADAEHLVRVLRAEVGEIYEISDNQDLYLARITTARKSLVTFEVIETLASPAETTRCILLPALFKFDHFELLIEKATELGVRQICPFEAVRTERGLLQASVKRNQRWQRIAVEASQQSRRSHLPHIAEATRFHQAAATPADVKLFLDEDPAALPILSLLNPVPARAESFALLTGPEGGWTNEERTQAIATGWSACSLGSTILRAETAAIAGLAILRAYLAARAAATITSKLRPERIEPG